MEQKGTYVVQGADGRVHGLRGARCTSLSCLQVHWVCGCGGWTGSSVANEAGNVERWAGEHLQDVLREEG